MAINYNFKRFVSTVNPFRPGGIFATRRVLTSGSNGAPVGIQSDGDGPDGIWALIDVTAAQVASPSAVMLADLDATYRLNVAPYTRYISTGSALTTAGGGAADIVPATGLFANMIAYSPLTIDQPDGLTVFGQLRVINFPA